MRDKICVAMDMDLEGAFRTLNKLQGIVSWVKIGPALLTSQYGATLLKTAKDTGFKVFADYKFKDIPSVVGKGITNLINVADLVTVHIDGGYDMLIAAKQAAGDNLKVIGVTLLTSLGETDLQEFGYYLCDRGGVDKAYIDRMVKLVHRSGLDGIVCAGSEVKSVKDLYPQLFCVTPGLKINTFNMEDQKRGTDPRHAYRQGSDLLVIGRDIYQAEDPVKRIEEIEKWCLAD